MKINEEGFNHANEVLPALSVLLTYKFGLVATSWIIRPHEISIFCLPEKTQTFFALANSHFPSSDFSLPTKFSPPCSPSLQLSGLLESALAALLHYLWKEGRGEE